MENQEELKASITELAVLHEKVEDAAGLYGDAVEAAADKFGLGKDAIKKAVSAFRKDKLPEHMLKADEFLTVAHAVMPEGI